MSMSNEDGMVMVPYIVYEGEQARAERHSKRLVTALIVTILLLFGTNALWLCFWMQYDYSGEELTTTHLIEAKDGIANYIGNSGDIVNGSNYRDNENNSAQENAEEEVE